MLSHQLIHTNMICSLSQRCAKNGSGQEPAPARVSKKWHAPLFEVCRNGLCLRHGRLFLRRKPYVVRLSAATAHVAGGDRKPPGAVAPESPKGLFDSLTGAGESPLPRWFWGMAVGGTAAENTLGALPPSPHQGPKQPTVRNSRTRLFRRVLLCSLGLRFTSSATGGAQLRPFGPIRDTRG